MLVAAACNSCNRGGGDGMTVEEMVNKHKAIRIGTDPNGSIPFVFGKGVDVQGLDVDIGNEIAKDYNSKIEVKWIKLTGYDRVYEALANNEVEFVISALAINSMRSDKFAYSHPYYESEDAIAYKKGNPYETLSSLSGKKVAVAAGRPSDKFMAGQQGITVVRFANIDDALGALNRGEVEAVVGDRQIMTYSTFVSFNQILISQAGFNPYRYAAVVRKSETKLLESINKSIDLLKSAGKLAELNKKWYENVKVEAINKKTGWENEEAIKKSPKTIAVTITNNRKSIEMDRMDGFQLVLAGLTGEYRSSPINTNGNKGICKFAKPVPPGSYKLDMRTILGASASVEIQPLPKDSLIMDIIIGNEMSIIIK
jgi:ABC-type amino acid transport substrate-binding protein